MQDFIRIRGEITSNPLNENFRRMVNAIDIANTNLVFPESNAVVDTLTDMYAIPDPVNAQWCYVISSGELYRYAKRDDKWHKIGDFGQTFRQGFLNSGAVVLEDEIKYKSNTVLAMPSMLVYFKNQPGDERYLKGMYLVEKQDFDATEYLAGPGAYSITVDHYGLYDIIPGMPSFDDPNNVFIGTFLVNGDSHIIRDCIYTLPDIAYTADRGAFFVYGGQANGLSLVAGGANDATVGRSKGSYYDEGANYAKGNTKDFPYDCDNGSNFNLKAFEAEDTVDQLYYLIPENPMEHNFIISPGIINDKYWKDGKLTTVTEDMYTVQYHLVTPTGQNFMIFGDTEYNSFEDAESNLNTPEGLELNFPYVEATRVIVRHSSAPFSTDDASLCRFYKLSRLAQVGTISPIFADDAFKIYSGDTTDITPATMRFDLRELQKEQFNNIYSLDILPYNTTRQKFSMTSKYFTDDYITTVSKTEAGKRSYDNPGILGYKIADDKDLEYIRNRIDDIEKEIWSAENNSKQRYEQSIKYRLFHIESRLDENDKILDDHEKRITYVEKYKVHKNTTINGQKLGDGTTNDEAKAIILKTGDIAEGQGIKGEAANLWYTDDRVYNNSDVTASRTHRNTKSTGTKDDILSKSSLAGHTQVNPHNLSTDDLVILTGSKKLFVDPDQERRIRSDKLPDDTKAELNKKLEFITVTKTEGDSSKPGAKTNVGNATTLNVYTHGANVTYDASTKTATLECVGQIDPDDFLLRKEFAVSATARPDLYAGAVDRALNADNVTALNDATASQYYGTDEKGNKGVFDLPVYVSTDDATSYTDLDVVTFQPINKSVGLKHLANSKVIYTNKDEESILNTNVYDLVKNHYHKVFNSGSQGPYLNGSTTQDTSAIRYEYTITSGGLKSDTYYFNIDNDNYKFTGNTTMSAGKKLVFNPATKTLKIDNTIVSITAVTPEQVDEEKWISFVAKTDWNKINEWNFGNNLTVTVTDGRATINAAVAGTGATNFANLGDVSVTYNEENVGKIVCLGKDTSNNYILKFMNAPALNNYMLIADYVASTLDKKVKLAAQADNATTAVSANTLQTKYTVNDSSTSNTVLWTASKIRTNTTSQIKSEGVNTYYGKTAPGTIAGAKDGDIYILIEG